MLLPPIPQYDAHFDFLPVTTSAHQLTLCILSREDTVSSHRYDRVYQGDLWKITPKRSQMSGTMKEDSRIFGLGGAVCYVRG
jgi:hypothetical protein